MLTRQTKMVLTVVKKRFRQHTILRISFNEATQIVICRCGDGAVYFEYSALERFLLPATAHIADIRDDKNGFIRVLQFSKYDLENLASAYETIKKDYFPNAGECFYPEGYDL